MPDPRKPRRAELKPSDWSPRSIPQPAPERRTADPHTPPLRELAERERQRVSLAAAPGAAAPAAAVTPENAHFPAGLPAQLRTGADCQAAWGAFGREAQDVLRTGGSGDGDANPIARNRAISQAYAQFYQRNPQLEWAGIASMVSNNAGCAMRAAGAVRADADRDAGRLLEAQRYAPPIGGEGGGGEFIEPGVRGWASGVAHDTLADGNKEIFRNIFPVLRMHERYGDAGLGTCSTRPGETEPIPPRTRDALSDAFSDDPELRSAAGAEFANYEQREVLEKKVMNSSVVKGVFLANQVAARTALGRAEGAQAPEVRLTSGCNDGTPAVPFDGWFTNPDSRAAYYVRRLVPAFERLPAPRRDAIIGQLARGRGGEAP